MNEGATVLSHREPFPSLGWVVSHDPKSSAGGEPAAEADVFCVARKGGRA